jgi:hypothetical protein
MQMTKDDALKLIDDHKNKLINPVEMLHWTWLRVIILMIEDDEWQGLLKRALPILSR